MPKTRVKSVDDNLIVFPILSNPLPVDKGFFVAEVVSNKFGFTRIVPRSDIFATTEEVMDAKDFIEPISRSGYLIISCSK